MELQQQQQQAAKKPSQSESSSHSDNPPPPQSHQINKKNKKLKHQQKLARLVASTFGPDSIDLFKSTISAAAAVESAVAAHAAQTLTGNNNLNKSKKSSNDLGNLIPAASAGDSLIDQDSSSVLASHTKTTKKLNKKFDLLQKKITSLIESNHLEPVTFTTTKKTPASTATSKTAVPTNTATTTTRINLNSFKNFHIDDDDEVSEVGAGFRIT